MENLISPSAIPTGSCTLFQYQCDNGNCVMGSDVCNGQDNCGDNSDETQCGRSKYYMMQDGAL